MKKFFSNRFFGNLLIVLLGLVILFVVGVTSYRIWFASADGRPLPEIGIIYPEPTYNSSVNEIEQWRYRTIDGVSFPFIEVYNTDWIASSIGSRDADYPARKLNYFAKDDQGLPISGKVVVIPLANFDYLINTINQSYSYTAREGSTTHKLLKIISQQLGSENSVRTEVIRNSLSKYETAIRFSTSAVRVNGNTLCYQDPDYENISGPSAQMDDPHVTRNQLDFCGQTDSWALEMDISPTASYSEASSQSLAQRMLQAGIDATGSIGDTTNNTKIREALANYNRQIQSSNGSEGLTLTSVDKIQYGETQTITFKVDRSKLTIPAGKYLAMLMLNINDANACGVQFVNISSSGSGIGCSYNDANSTGTFQWGPEINGETTLGTKSPGIRTLTFKAFYKPAATGEANQLGIITKTVTVAPQSGSETTTGSFGLSIKAPRSVNQTAENPITITADLDALRTAGGAAGLSYLKWYTCEGTKEVVISNASGVVCNLPSNVAEADLTTATGQISKTVNWDSRFSTFKDHVILVKAFGKGANAGQNPEIVGSKTVSNSILVTDVPLNDGDGDEGGGDDGDGDNTHDGGGSNSGWLTNFKQSGLTTLDGVLNRVGSFALTILAVLAVLALIIAGMKYITAGGDTKSAEAGKKGIIYAVYGIAAATLVITLVKTTINEVKGIIGQTLQSPDNPDKLLPTDIAGPNASIATIINSDSGLIWRFIQLAVYYSEMVAAFYILYASFLYITSYGDDSKAESAKKTLIWSIIGLAFVISANIILDLFSKVIV